MDSAARRCREFLADHGAFLCMMGFSLVFFFYRLGDYSLMDSDEPWYGMIARTMAERNDYITPFWNGRPLFCHPPLFFWMTALTGQLFGWSEWAIRLIPALFSVALVAVTHAFSLALFKRKREALYSALIFMTSLQVFVQGRMTLLDGPFYFFMAMALLVFYRFHDNPSGNNILWFWIWCSLATCAKGPLGVCLPLGIACAFMALRGEWRRIPSLRWGPGLLILMVIASPWYMALSLMHGRTFTVPVFGYFIMTRFFGTVDNQPGPFYYYIPVIIGGFFPWSAFLPMISMSWAQARREKAALFLILLTTLTFVFFSCAGTKLPNYIFIVYLPLAIGCAHWFCDESRKARETLAGIIVLMILSALIVAAALLYGPSAGERTYRILKPALLMPGLILTLMPVAAMVLYFIRRPLIPAVIVAAAVMLHVSTVNAYIIFDRGKPMKAIGTAIRELRRPGEPVGITPGLDGSNSMIYYAGSIFEYCCEGWDRKKFLQSHKTFYYIAKESEFPQLQWYARKNLYIIRHVNDYILITDRPPGGRMQ